MEIAPDAPLMIRGMSFNMMTLYMSWLVMAILVFAAWKATRRLDEVPGRWQLCMELFVDFFDSLAEQALGERGRKYLPFVGTVFLFVWGCNLIGLIPHCEEPTRDLNTPIGLAILAIGTAQLSAILVKGIGAWWWEFFEPSFPAKGVGGTVLGLLTAVVAAGVYLLVVVKVVAAMSGFTVAGRVITVVALLVVGLALVATAVISIKSKRVPNMPMAPLNFVGEVGKSVSLPFRLYGNIFFGAVIIIVISTLLKQIVLPLILLFFFGIFVGTIQAFVFAMLSLTYIAVAITEDEGEEAT